MIIKKNINKEDWENFLLLCLPVLPVGRQAAGQATRKTFLHSWNWGEFQKDLGNTVWRWGVYDNEQLVSVVLVIKHVAKRGSFLLIPHGPVTNNQDTRYKKQILETLLSKLKELAKGERVDFIRISPIWERTPENEKLFKDLGFRLRPLHTHPESSWKLNIELPEEKLLAGMRKTTRDLIKQAEKDKNLEVIQSFSIKDVQIFNQMHLEVVKHQNFVPFSLEYFKKEFETFVQDKEIALFFAYYKGKPIAASYGIFWSGMAFYHHAALLPEYKKIPAAYLLQWRAIQEAKKRGCKIYDFWGYSDPVKYPNHPYSGPTLFKMGFGGYKDEYVKTQDYIISQKYWINYIIELVRKIRRGLY